MYAILRTWKAWGRKSMQELVPGSDGPALCETVDAAQKLVKRLQECTGWFVELPDGRRVPYTVTHQVVPAG